MGVYCYVKHLICNDQESGIYRDGVYTWMTEQTLRETYLKPFQMIVHGSGASVRAYVPTTVWALCGPEAARVLFPVF
ncbi:MAG: hypothetical protein V8R61_07100 [Enterocloster sp.]